MITREDIDSLNRFSKSILPYDSGMSSPISPFARRETGRGVPIGGLMASVLLVRDFERWGDILYRVTGTSV